CELEGGGTNRTLAIPEPLRFVVPVLAARASVRRVPGARVRLARRRILRCRLPHGDVVADPVQRSHDLLSRGHASGYSVWLAMVWAIHVRLRRCGPPRGVPVSARLGRCRPGNGLCPFLRG